MSVERLWWMLRYAGFDDVSVLDGGLDAWRKAGLPLERGSEEYPPTEFVSRTRPDLLASRNDVDAGGAMARIAQHLSN